LVIEGLRVELSGGTEARRVVEDRVEGIAGERADLRGDVAVGQRQAAAGFGRPGIEAAQPDHVGVLLVGMDLARPALQAPGGEVAEAAAGVEDQLAARLDQSYFAFGVRVGRDARCGQHLDAVDFERRRAPFGRHQLDQRRGEARHRLKGLANPVVDGSVLAGFEVGEAFALPGPLRNAHLDGRCRAIQVQRALDRRRASARGGAQDGMHFFRQQWTDH